jgi:WD40 repeat protein
VEWTKELANAAVFSTYHNSSAAALSTPHVYISSLATFPRHSRPLQQWRDRFQGIPRFVNASGVRAVLSTFLVGSEVKAIAVSPHNLTVAVVTDSGLSTWDLSTGEKLKVFEGHTGVVTSVAFSPDSTQVASGSLDRSARVWDISSGEEVKPFQGHTDWVSSLAFSPNRNQVVSGSGDYSVRVWAMSSGEEVKTFQGHTNCVRFVAFSPDGARVVLGSYDHFVRVWNVSSGGLVKAFEGHTNWVMSVAFSPDGTLVVSGSHDRSVRVWDISSGDQVKAFRGHTGMVYSVALSPDGTQVVSGSGDTSVLVWDISSGEEVNAFQGDTLAVTSIAASPKNTLINDQSVRLSACPQEPPKFRYTREKGADARHTGWLLSPSDSSAYLMFFPLQAKLPDDSNILTIPSTMVPKLDLSQAKLGDRWAECYTPTS